MMGKENSLIKYGEVTVASEVEGLDRVRATLSAVLKEHGYPGAPKKLSQGEFEEELAAIDGALDQGDKKMDWEETRGEADGEEDRAGDGV